MDTKKLRQKILDLAIRGKLVPQDPNDEPASVLLERIRAEKEQLIKEGKIKRSKKSAATDKSHYENVPFEIPESWCWTTLGELCSIKGGKRLPKGKSFADTITPHIYIRVTDMKDHTVLLSSLKYIDEDVFAEIKNYTISSNDLYLTIAGTIGDVGLVPAELDGANLTENAAKLTDIKCSKQYLMYVLMSSIAQDHFCSRFHQVAQPKLSLETASSTLIPLPPYREQLRIAEGLDRWLGVVVSVEDDLSELTNYVRKTKSKILDHAISGKLVPQDPNDEPAIELLKRINPDFEPCDNSHYENLPFEVPDGWCWATLGSIGKWQSGATPSRMRKDYYGGDIPWLKTGDLNDWYITDIPEYITQQALNETSVKLNPAGSILIAMYGATIGKIGILTMPATTNQACCACISHNGIEQMYLFYYLLSHKEEFVRQGGGGAQPNISKEKIVETLIPIPPLSEQLRIIKAIEAIFNQIDNITAELS